MSHRAFRVIGLAAAVAAHSPVAAQAQEETLVRPELPVDQTEYVTVNNRVEDRVAEFVIGPVALPKHVGHLRLPIQMAEIPVDGWMHGFEVEMLAADGSTLPADLLHHVNLIDPDQRDLFSPIARRVVAAGRETGRMEMPDLLGYPVQAGDRVIISAMFANPVGEDFPEAFLHVRLLYSLEEDGFMQPRDVYPFYLDVMGPVGLKDFPVPPGRTVRYWEGSPAIEGRIVGIGGHLHNYATELRLEDMTTGKTIWSVEPELDENGTVAGVPLGKLWWRGGVKIVPDHVYRITVEYYNPTDAPAPDGGMGEMGGVLWASKDVQWPAFDRDDPIYVADLINTLTAPERLGGHGHGSHGDQPMKPMNGDGGEAVSHEGMDHQAAAHTHDR